MSSQILLVDDEQNVLSALRRGLRGRFELETAEGGQAALDMIDDRSIPLGFASAILPDQPLEEVLTFASEVGYDCVEIMCWPVGKAERRYSGVTHIDVQKLDAAEVARIEALTKRTGVSISGLGYYPNCLSPNAEEAKTAVEHLKKVITAAPALGLKQVNTFIGRDYTQSVHDNWPRLLDTWGPIVELAGNQGVRIGIENCPMLFSKDEWPGGKNIATSPSIWRRLFTDLASTNLGLNYDRSYCVCVRLIANCRAGTYSSTWTSNLRRNTSKPRPCLRTVALRVHQLKARWLGETWAPAILTS